MGSIALMDSSGHVQIDWTPNSINIDLRPSEGKKATANERTAITQLCQQCADKGMSVLFDDKKQGADLTLGKSVKNIHLSLDPPGVKSILEALFKSDIYSNQILFELDADGRGKLVQKTISEFTVDPADKKEYKSTKALSGG